MELRSQHPDYVHYDFNKAIDINRDWLIEPSNYLAQLEPYRRFYGDESIHVVFYEDFCDDPNRVMQDCFRFLGVDPNVDVGAATARLNESDGKAIASPWLSRLRSISLFRRAIDRLPLPPRERFARKFLYRAVRHRPKWHPATRAWVSDILRHDLERFLVRYGKPAAIGTSTPSPLSTGSMADSPTTLPDHPMRGRGVGRPTKSNCWRNASSACWTRLTAKW